jgi:seryl-tRNA synthetase
MSTDNNVVGAVDKELEAVNKKMQILQKERERFAMQLEAKRRASEKLDKINQAKEQLEKMQREIEEMKEQENSSLWRESPYQNSSPRKRPSKDNFFTCNEVSQFADPELPPSLSPQTTSWSSKYKPMSLPKYNDYADFR